MTRLHAERIKKESLAATKLPRSDLSLLAQKLNASFLTPKSHPIKLIDKAYAKLSGTSENWAYARDVASQLKSDDVVFCPGEEIGIPLALACSTRKERPKIVIWFHRITGLKSRLALKLFNISNLVDLAIVSSIANKNFLKNYLGWSDEQVLFIWHPLDVEYFAPKSPPISCSSKLRPLIVSLGLEQRDYRLLAAATAELDVEVKVAGFSQFQSRVAKSFPKVMPANMTNRKYSWFDLMRLYRDADIVAICLKENSGAAGVTVLLEAMAHKKPIVCVRTTGIANYLSDEQAVLAIKPGDVAGLQKAILYLLDNPKEAELRAKRALQLVMKRHNVDGQVDVMQEFIQTLEQQ